MRSALIALGLAVAAAHPAMAQNAAAPAAPAVPPNIAQLKAYVGTQEYVARLAQIALAGEKDISGATCKEAKPIDRATFTVIRPPVFQGGVAHPVSGEWKDSIAIDRCGKKVVHNVLFVARPNGAPGMGLMMPGATGATAELQVTVLQKALPVAMDKAKCKDSKQVVVSDTRHEKELQKGKLDDKGRLIAGSWQEVWTFQSCGKPVDVPVVFTADGKGKVDVKVTGAKK